jgi:glycosyltransferase involved in cell wall biosynthesis
MSLDLMVSIVIPTWRRQKLLEKLLFSVLSQSDAGLDTEIIIVGSIGDYETERMMLRLKQKYFKNKIIYTNNILNNPAAKRNYGIEKAAGDWIVFLDDDCVPSNDYLNNLKKEILKLKNNKVVLCGEIRYPREWVRNSNYFRYRDSRHFKIDGRSKKKLDFQTITTMNMAIHAKSIKADGVKFDDKYGFHCEDIDFGVNLQHNGYTFQPSKLTIIHYETSTNLSNYCKKLSKMRLDGMPRFTKKFPNEAGLIIWSRFTYSLNEPLAVQNLVLKIIYSKWLFSFILKYLKVTDKYRLFYNKFLFHYILLGSYLGACISNS